MSLTDPTSGAGYSFGERLPSSHMTTIATQQPNALDAVGGGTWSSLAAGVTINGSAARTWTWGGNITQSVAGGIEIASGGSFDVLSGGAGTINSGGTLTFKGTANWPLVDSQTIVRSCDITPVYMTANVATNASGFIADSSTAGEAMWDITHCCPDDATLTAVRVRLAPAVHGSLPANVPTLYVYSVDDAGSGTTLVTQADTSANVSAYNAIHTISGTGISQTIDRESFQRIMVHVIGESGASSQTNLQILNCRAEFTITKLAPGA